MGKTKLKGILAVVAVLIAFGAIAGVKAFKGSGKSGSAIASDVQGAQGTAYLFMNSKDTNCDCERVYALFDELSPQLPAGIKAIKVDSNDADQSLAKKFSVLVLPTVIFVNDKGEIQHRIEGDGEEVEAKVKSVFESASKGSEKS